MNFMTSFYANMYDTFYKSYLLNTQLFFKQFQAPSSPSPLTSLASSGKPFLKQKDYTVKKKVSVKELLGYV